MVEDSGVRFQVSGVRCQVSGAKRKAVKVNIPCIFTLCAMRYALCDLTLIWGPGFLDSCHEVIGVWILLHAEGWVIIHKMYFTA